MFVFGHVGVGYRLAKPWAQRLPLRYLLLGTLLPDLIDKTLYYSAAFLTGRRGVEIGLMSGTRTWGHTLIFLIALGWVALIRRKPPWTSLWLGVLTHFLLDYFSDFFRASGRYIPEADPLYALLFPYLGWRFPYSPFHDATEHMQALVVSPFILASEVLGIWIVYQEGWLKKAKAFFFR